MATVKKKPAKQKEPVVDAVKQEAAEQPVEQPTAEKQKEPASLTKVSAVVVTNVSKHPRRIPSTGIVLAPGETKEVIYDNWVRFIAEAGYFKIH